MPTGGITAYVTPINAWRKAYVNDDEINERIGSDTDEQPHPFGNAFATNYSDDKEEVDEDSDEVLPPQSERPRTWDGAARQRRQHDKSFCTSWLRLYPWLSLRHKDPMGLLTLPVDHRIVSSDIMGSVMAS